MDIPVLHPYLLDLKTELEKMGCVTQPIRNSHLWFQGTRDYLWGLSVRKEQGTVSITLYSSHNYRYYRGVFQKHSSYSMSVYDAILVKFSEIKKDSKSKIKIYNKHKSYVYDARPEALRKLAEKIISHLKTNALIHQEKTSISYSVSDQSIEDFLQQINISKDKLLDTNLRFEKDPDSHFFKLSTLPYTSLKLTSEEASEILPKLLVAYQRNHKNE